VSASTGTFVVGTAGHIDHGKTSLVRALTGVDLDSLPEEKKRGITIALGFTHLALDDGRRAAFVDVPGHERLVRTMIAGASGLDAVVLCVSAVEGVMPQTREHLAILQLLGVRHGLIALTMVDLLGDGDDAEEMLELAADDVADTVAGTFLEGAPILPTSAQEGQGLDALKAAIAALPVGERDTSGPFRLPVDRCFLRRGFGVVITGTVLSGQIHDGDEVMLLPQGEKARVRGIQVHGGEQAESHSGLRTALNLAGPQREDLPRGTVVAATGGVAVTSILDVRYQHLADAPPLERKARVRLLIGTAEVMAVADPLDAPDRPVATGERRLLQLRCAEPVACLPGDRLVLRRQSPVTTLGGGEVLDPWAPRVRRRDAAASVALLERLEAGDTLARIDRAGPLGLSRTEALARLGTLPDDALTLGDRVLGAPAILALEQFLLADLAATQVTAPLSTGIGRRELKRGRLEGLSAPAFDGLIARLDAAGALVVEGPRVRLPDWQVVLSADQAAAETRLMAQLATAGLDTPTLKDLLEEGLAGGEALVALLMERGELEKIGGRLYRADVLARLVGDVRALLAQVGELSPQAFKELTGLSRRGAIPLLEWLDAQGVTRRQGDVRVGR
jgi:selenocysteine-specific elongation factor